MFKHKINALFRIFGSMKPIFPILFLSFISNLTAFDGSLSNKGYGYAYWGYNRSFFSNSDIHFFSENYDFTLKNVKASDRPQKFSLENYFAPNNISVPQYCFRFGYYLTDNIHISGGMDHMKYVVDQNQMVEINGVIESKTNTKYNGAYLRDMIEIKKGFLDFEHTDGLNLVTLQCDYSIPIVKFINNNFQLRFNAGVGGIWVGTRSDVQIIDEGIDNDHHLAGYSLTAQFGPRIEFRKMFFLDFQSRVGYMSLRDIFIENESAPKRASQEFSFISYYGSLGIMIPLSKYARDNRKGKR